MKFRGDGVVDDWISRRIHVDHQTGHLEDVVLRLREHGTTVIYNSVVENTEWQETSEEQDDDADKHKQELSPVLLGLRSRCLRHLLALHRVCHHLGGNIGREVKVMSCLQGQGQGNSGVGLKIA